MSGDDRHTQYPSMDVRWKDPFFVANEFKELKDNQTKADKVNEGLRANIDSLAAEVLDLKSAFQQERDNAATQMAKAQDEIKKLTAEVESLNARLHEKESQETSFSSERYGGHPSNDSDSNHQPMSALSMLCLNTKIHELKMKSDGLTDISS